MNPPVIVTPSRRRPTVFRGITFALILLGVLVLALMVFTSPSRGREKQLIWLSQAQFTAANRPGPLTRLKYKVMNIAGPLWRHFQRAKKQVLIETSFLE